MSGQGRTLAVLGGVLAAAVAAAIWLAGGSSQDEGAEAGGPADAGGAGSGASAPQPGEPAGRARKKGTAGVFGEIRRSAGKAPVAGQEVRLAPERGEAYVATTDASGSFRIAGVPHGETFELTAAAPGCGTIRIPGIALDRNEQRNVGTLWLDPSVPLLVRVRTGADEPVEGATVLAYADPNWVDYDWSKAFAQMAAEPVPVARATSDAQGEARFPEMAVGGWTLVASKAPLARGSARSVTLRSGESPDPVTIRLRTGHSLDGRVTSHDGRPVADALVLAAAVETSWDTDAAPLRARTRTDDDGRYELSMLEAGDAQIWVARGGGAPSSVATVRIPLIRHYDLVLRATGTLAGTVTAQDGDAPLEGVTVRAVSWEAATACADSVTGADGRFRLEAPAGAVNELTAEKEGFVLVRSETKLGMNREAVVREGAVTTRDLVMARGARLTGTVRGPDGPLSGARVLVHLGTPEEGFRQVPAVTGADGRYEFASLESGNPLVLCEKDGYWLEGAPENWWEAAQSESSAPDLRVKIPESGEATRDFAMRPGLAVAGTVTGPGGEPLAGARVSAPGAVESAPTGADGRFRIEGVKPGANVLFTGRCRGWVAAAPAQAAVAVGAANDGVVVRMMRQPVVRGRVTSASGAALDDVRVAAAAVQSSDHPAPWDDMWRWSRATRLGVRGGGAFEGPAPYHAGQSLVLRASAAGVADGESAPIPFTEGRETYDVDVVLAEGAELAGVVRSKSGAPVAGAAISYVKQFEAGDMGGTFSWSGGPESPVAAVTDAEGRFSVPHVAPGSYDVRASARGFVTAQLVAAVGSGPPVTLELSPELTIEGRVVLADGTPVEGVDVNAAGDGAAPVEFGGITSVETGATTDARGAFRISELGEGAYTVIATVPWRAQINVRPARVEGVAAGSKDVKVVMEAGAQLQGRVTDARGRPVAHASVDAEPQKQVEGRWESHNAQSGADGSFTLLGLSAGPHKVEVSGSDASGTNYRSARLAGVMPGPRPLLVVLEDGLEITGVVTGPDDRPVAHLALEATPAAPGADGSDARESAVHAETDGEGRFRFEGLGPGGHRIGISSWASSGVRFVISGGDEIQAGTRDVRLAATLGATISGVVVDESGRPVGGVWVSAAAPGGGTRSTHSRPDGTFEVTGLSGAGPFKLFTHAAKYVQAEVGDVASGARGVKIVLEKGLDAAGRVVDAAGNPVRNANLVLSRTDGRPSTVVQTGADGRFSASGLAAGTYEAAVVVPGAAGGESKSCGQVRAGDMNVELRAQ